MAQAVLPLMALTQQNSVIKINYPGLGNSSAFTFNGVGQNVSIDEKSNGTVTNTQQFVWCGSSRCESRDAGSATLSQFFKLGQTLSSSPYFYSLDQLGSVREVTNGIGTISFQSSYDPFGSQTSFQSSNQSDFQYANYYFHRASKLNLTINRAYDATLGRWINRDPIAERGGINLFAYMANNPTNGTDPSGLDCKEHCRNVCADLYPPCSPQWALCRAACYLLCSTPWPGPWI